MIIDLPWMLLLPSSYKKIKFSSKFYLSGCLARKQLVLKIDQPLLYENLILLQQDKKKKTNLVRGEESKYSLKEKKMN